MAIPESQLDTWSAQGAGVGSRDTYGAVRRALEGGSYNNSTPSIFLQGSYGNDTNVWSESDVDVVIKTEQFFYYDIDRLSAVDQAAFHAAYPNGASSYNYSAFKSDVAAALTVSFEGAVTPGKRAIAIAAEGKRRRADVIVAGLFRDYDAFPSISAARFTEGICFFTSGWEKIVNYPRQHSANCTRKHQNTNGWFKPSVRILKNLRRCLVDDGKIEKGIAPSYFLEGLLYNLPANYFGISYQKTIENALSWLNGLSAEETKNLVCANERYYLVRDYNVTWAPADYSKFLAAATELWKNW